MRVHAEEQGRLLSVYASAGDEIAVDQCLAELETACAHSVVFNGLCTSCGRDMTRFPQRSGPKAAERYHVLRRAPETAVSAAAAAATASAAAASVAGRFKDRVLVLPSGHKLEFSAEALRADKARNSARLRAARRLVLVLDLDHTIVHASPDARAEELLRLRASSSSSAPSARAPHPSGAPLRTAEDVFRIELATREVHFVKLREGLARFLAALRTHFDMRIYTLSARPYAERVVSLFDPDNGLVRNIVSRSDFDLGVKSVELLVACDDSLVVILDDRDDVWRHSLPNLVHVHHYNFFEGFEETYNRSAPPGSTQRASGPSHSAAPSPAAAPLGSSPSTSPASSASSAPPASPSSPSPPSSSVASPADAVPADQPPASIAARLLTLPADNVLESLQHVLEAVHELCYAPARGASGLVRTAQEAIALVRRSVLSGVRLVLSGVVPLGHDPRQSEMWRLAEALGAECHDEVNGLTTHVVAARPGTAKVREAEARRIYVVHADWLTASAAHFVRADERLFPLENPQRTGLVYYCPRPPSKEQLVERALRLEAALEAAARAQPVQSSRKRPRTEADGAAEASGDEVGGVGLGEAAEGQGKEDQGQEEEEGEDEEVEGPDEEEVVDDDEALEDDEAKEEAEAEEALLDEENGDDDDPLAAESQSMQVRPPARTTRKLENNAGLLSGSKHEGQGEAADAEKDELAAMLDDALNDL